MSKVSFTIRRPTPISRQSSSGVDSDDSSTFKVPALPPHLAGRNGASTPSSPLARSTNNSAPPSPKPKTRTYEERDSSDEEEAGTEDEIVTGFDEFGVQRLREKKKPEGPLVIAPLQNRDWREIARRRRGATERYVPESARAPIGANGSVGGLGTRDSINSGPVLAGLQVSRKKAKVEDEETIKIEEEEKTQAISEPETEEQKAIRALLASASGEGNDDDGPQIDIIPSSGNDWSRPADETDAYRQDVVTRPESATLDDYARVPVSQFGAALLRGMGWKEGTAASRTRKGPVEPYLPEARPALLGIGAKERIVPDDGGPVKKGSKRPEKRYVPVVKREKERGEGDVERERERDSERDSGGVVSSRRRLPSPHRGSASNGREHTRSSSPTRSRHTSEHSEGARKPSRRDDDYGRDREKDKFRDERRRGYDDRDRERDRDRRRDTPKDRDADRGGDRRRNMDRRD